MTETYPHDRQPSIRTMMMPRDTNALGTIFGGVILSYIDQAGAVEAHRHVAGRIVTVALREVIFHAPVFVGDLVSFWTSTKRLGTTSGRACCAHSCLPPDWRLSATCRCRS